MSTGHTASEWVIKDQNMERRKIQVREGAGLREPIAKENKKPHFLGLGRCISRSRAVVSR